VLCKGLFITKIVVIGWRAACFKGDIDLAGNVSDVKGVYGEVYAIRRDSDDITRFSCSLQALTDVLRTRDCSNC